MFAHTLIALFVFVEKRGEKIQRKTFYNKIKCEIERSVGLPQVSVTTRIEYVQDENETSLNGQALKHSKIPECYRKMQQLLLPCEF
jgi:hypothetical protein